MALSMLFAALAVQLDCATTEPHVWRHRSEEPVFVAEDPTDPFSSLLGRELERVSALHVLTDEDGDGAPELLIVSRRTGGCGTPLGHLHARSLGPGGVLLDERTSGIVSCIDVHPDRGLSWLALHGRGASTLETLDGLTAAPGYRVSTDRDSTRPMQRADGIEDLDGDSVGDVAFSSAWIYADGFLLGNVGVLSRGTGCTLWHRVGTRTEGLGLDSCVVDDIDRDGVSDVAVLGFTWERAVRATRVVLLSGASGVELDSIAVEPKTRQVAALGDIDGDGFGELCIQQRIWSVRRSAYLPGPSPDFLTFGDLAGDLDGDGVEDLLLAYEREGEVSLASFGLAGQVPLELPVERARDLCRVVGGRAADLDGDGDLELVLVCREALASAPAARPGWRDRIEFVRLGD